jgi:uncharacterized protein YbaA (DUF1428 family)
MKFESTGFKFHGKPVGRATRRQAEQAAKPTEQRGVTHECRNSRPSLVILLLAARRSQRQRSSRLNYVDGYVIAVPTANQDKYRRVAQAAATVFKENGALSVTECWGDDVPEGKVTSFSMAVQRKEDESVVFSWITWPSRAVRDEGMKRAMADPRLKAGMDPMPFDGKRMIFGGFQVIVSA